MHVIQLAWAVHFSGALLRWLKADNFMWTKTGEGEPSVRIVDFGLDPSWHTAQASQQNMKVSRHLEPEVVLVWTAAWRAGGTGVLRKAVQDQTSDCG